MFFKTGKKSVVLGNMSPYTEKAYFFKIYFKINFSHFEQEVTLF